MRSRMSEDGSAISLAAMPNALDGHDKEGVLDCVDHSIAADSDAERIVAADELSTTFWSRVACQTIDCAQDPTLHGRIESAKVLVGRAAKTNGVLRHSS